MLYMEVSEEEARRRVNELTFEKLAQKDERNDFVLSTHDGQLEDLFFVIEEFSETETEQVEFKLNQFLDSVKVDCHKALDVAYGAWTHGAYPRDVAAFNVKGTKGLITAGMSWGDSWETLEQFNLLNILEITCEREE